jgi:hypothetical protein
MKLYLLNRESYAPGEARAMQVRAATTDAARRLASAKAGAEGRDAWLHLDKSTCVEVPVEGEPGVVMIAWQDQAR